jgi:hypothetical protein
MHILTKCQDLKSGMQTVIKNSTCEPIKASRFAGSELSSLKGIEITKVIT